MNKWIKTSEAMPHDQQRVIAHYKGVYDYRLVTYWFDGKNHHFGHPNEPDGKGSQPATHWMELPELP